MRKAGAFRSGPSKAHCRDSAYARAVQVRGACLSSAARLAGGRRGREAVRVALAAAGVAADPEPGEEPGLQWLAGVAESAAASALGAAIAQPWAAAAVSSGAQQGPAALAPLAAASGRYVAALAEGDGRGAMRELAELVQSFHRAHWGREPWRGANLGGLLLLEPGPASPLFSAAWDRQNASYPVHFRSPPAASHSIPLPDPSSSSSATFPK